MPCARVLYGNCTAALSDSAFTPDTGKYCEFARLFGEEKFSEAGNLLVELLEAEVVPKRYRPTCSVLRVYVQRRPFVYSQVLCVTVEHEFVLL